MKRSSLSAKLIRFITSIHDISELPTHLYAEIKHFYEVYKSLEYKETLVKKIEGRDEAIKIIEECINRYSAEFVDGIKISLK